MAEDTHEADLITGLRVMADAVSPAKLKQLANQSRRCSKCLPI